MKYFGTDGIRGKAYTELSKELAVKIGKALIKLGTKNVVIATDTRESKDDLSKSVITGAVMAEMNVYEAGVVPTPALINYTNRKDFIGVMITASHNPYEDNGIKIVKNGVKLTVEQEKLIENELEKPLEAVNSNVSMWHQVNVEDEYLKFIKPFILETKLSVSLDCSNGAAYHIAPKVFKSVTRELFVTAHTPNGKNINEGVGSTHPEHLKHFMEFNKSDVGFAFDGDGDRVLAIENNEVIDGDQIIFIIAHYLKSQNKLNGNTVVLTKMSNIGILNKLEELDINYILTDVGDKHVTKELLNNNYSIGGENSGHIIMPESSPTGDGILVALKLIEIMTSTNKTLHQLLEGITMYADEMVNLHVGDKTVINSKEVQDTIRDIENSIDGKVIVRASGTENVLRVSVMAKTKEIVDENIDKLIEVIKNK